MIRYHILQLTVRTIAERFQNKELLAHIFSHVLHHVLEAGLIDPSEIFIDGTHIKAAANNHKYKNCCY